MVVMDKGKYVNRGSYFENKSFDYARIHLRTWYRTRYGMKYLPYIPYIFNMFRAALFDSEGNICGGRTISEKIHITPISLYRYINYRIKRTWQWWKK